MPAHAFFSRPSSSLDVSELTSASKNLPHKRAESLAEKSGRHGNLKLQWIANAHGPLLGATLHPVTHFKSALQVSNTIELLVNSVVIEFTASPIQTPRANSASSACYQVEGRALAGAEFVFSCTCVKSGDFVKQQI